MGSGKRRVAMLVLNDCATDGRVLRAGTALREAGWDVRVFATDSAAHARGSAVVDGLPVDRLAVHSLPERAYLRAARALGAGRPPRTTRRGTVALGAAAPHALPIVAADPAPTRPAVPTAPRAAARRLALRVHRPARYLAYTRAAAHALDAWRPDIVHAHDLPALPAAARAARRHGSRLVYDSHELWRERNRLGERRPLGRLCDAAVEGALIGRADLVLTVSGGIARWLSDRYRLPAPPVVVRNTPALGATRSHPRSLRELSGVPSGRILLYTGRIMAARGLETLLALLGRLPDDLSLILLGYGEAAYLGELSRTAHALGVADRLRVVPPVRPGEVAGLAAQADAALVVVEPTCESYRLALPNKLFEAVHAAVPVLASDLPEIAAVVAGHGVGELCRPGDPASMEVALRRLLADPASYRAAAAHARTGLSWEREREVLLGAYDRLATPVARSSASAA